MGSGILPLPTEVEVIQVIVTHAREVLTIYGIEGDEGGPLDELQSLENMLLEEE